MTADEGAQQFQATVTWDMKSGKEGKPAVNGSVYVDKHGVYRLFWIPQGGNYSASEKEELTGWYDIPSNEDIEEWTFDSVCFTPGDDEVEPDHPDSWLYLLGMI
jgi:hypothetical protein